MNEMHGHVSSDGVSTSLDTTGHLRSKGELYQREIFARLSSGAGTDGDFLQKMIMSRLAWAGAPAMAYPLQRMW
jgi:hypothetical protein